MRSTILVSLTTFSIGAFSLLTPPIAAADATGALEPEPTAVMGPAQEYQRGLTVNGVAPTLRSVVVDGESILAYCIEYWIRAADPDHEAAVTGWDEFTGDNQFKSDPQVRQHVAWILRHSYPTLSVAEVAEHTGTEELSATEIITATQAAIWHFTDDFVPDGNLVVEAGPDDTMRAHSAANVQAVFDYLTGSTNTGLTEQETQASVTLENNTIDDAEVPEAIDDLVDNDEDHVFGPILLNTSSDDVELAVHPSDDEIPIEDLVVMDPTGQVVDLDQAVSANELWVQIPAEMESGSVELSAESIEFGYTGRLIIPEPDNQRRFQTIVVVDQTTSQAATEIELAWEKPVVEEPEPADESPSTDPSPDPSNTPPVEEPDVEEPPADDPSVTAPTEDPTPPPAQPESSAPPEAVENSVVSTPSPEEPAETEPAAELATTGAHQTRNVLVALGTIAVGACLLIVNRLRKRRT